MMKESLVTHSRYKPTPGDSDDEDDKAVESYELARHKVKVLSVQLNSLRHNHTTQHERNESIRQRIADLEYNLQFTKAKSIERERQQREIERTQTVLERFTKDEIALQDRVWKLEGELLQAERTLNTHDRFKREAKPLDVGSNSRSALLESTMIAAPYPSPVPKSTPRSRHGHRYTSRPAQSPLGGHYPSNRSMHARQGESPSRQGRGGTGDRTGSSLYRHVYSMPAPSSATSPYYNTATSIATSHAPSNANTNANTTATVRFEDSVQQSGIAGSNEQFQWSAQMNVPEPSFITSEILDESVQDSPQNLRRLSDASSSIARGPGGSDGEGASPTHAISQSYRNGPYSRPDAFRSEEEEERFVMTNLETNRGASVHDYQHVRFSEAAIKLLARTITVSPKTLTSLTLVANGLHVTGADLVAEALAFCSNIEHLTIADNNIEDEGVRVIAEAIFTTRPSVLATLSLSGNGITPGGLLTLVSLLGCPETIALSSLDLSYNPLGDEGALIIAERLTHSPSSAMNGNDGQTTPTNHLQQPQQRQQPAIAAEISTIEAVVSEAAPSQAQLHSTINYGPFHTSDDWVSIPKFHRDSPLTTLDLTSTSITPAGVSAICTALCTKANNTLTTLNLGFNSLRGKDETAVPAFDAIRELLRCPSSNIQTLKLERTGVDDLALARVCDGIKSSTTSALRNLVLTSNKITGQALRTSLKDLFTPPSSCALESLSLQDNLISNGVTAFATSLKANTTLIELDISWNRMAPRGGHALAFYLQHHGALQRLDVSHNHIGPESIRLLEKMVRRQQGRVQVFCADNAILSGGGHSRDSQRRKKKADDPQGTGVNVAREEGSTDAGNARRKFGVVHDAASAIGSPAPSTLAQGEHERVEPVQGQS